MKINQCRNFVGWAADVLAAAENSEEFDKLNQLGYPQLLLRPEAFTCSKWKWVPVSGAVRSWFARTIYKFAHATRVRDNTQEWWTVYPNALHVATMCPYLNSGNDPLIYWVLQDIGSHVELAINSYKTGVWTQETFRAAIAYCELAYRAFAHLLLDDVERSEFEFKDSFAIPAHRYETFLECVYEYCVAQVDGTLAFIKEFVSNE